MKPEDTELKRDDHCAVCDKSVGHGEGFSHIKVENMMIALCCPLCFDTFSKDPAKYIRVRSARKLYDETHPPGSFSSFEL